MNVLIFFIVLGVLVLVHEFGHFFVAKKAGVRVDEFGFGFPPRALTLGRKWKTDFTLNWIPFGGFVKIYGENGESGEKSFINLSKKWQAAILAAGVFFNFIFAWILFSLAFLLGVPAPINNEFGGQVNNAVLTVTEVLAETPAKEAGLKSGDKIISVVSAEGVLEVMLPKNFSDFIDASIGEVKITTDRGGDILNFEIIPQFIEKNQDKMIGVGVDMVGILRLPPHKAFYQGIKTTLLITHLTAQGLGRLLIDSFRGQADLSQITGPVGIIGLVGDASKLGFAYLTTFTALISINLALVNLIPFPALDGGRIVFVVIEGLTRKKINPKVAGTLNTVGFALLILLMLFITYRDILKLF